MTTRKYSSRSQQSTLTGAITSGATSITVVSGTALLGGVTIPAGQTFTLVIDVDTALEEIVDATAVSTNTFTITRGIDGSTAQDHSAGAVVRHMAIGRDYRDANLHAEADASYNDGSGSAHTMHGIGAGEGVVVGTLKAQTLTNKTLTTPTVNGATVTGTVTASSATFVSPTISGSPVITGLSSAGMVDSSATPKNYVDSILGSATAAATSAASAATSATSAATSASSASTSASSALTSANSASTSATAAATSATSAAASATAAATSATSAAASATAASTSALSASTSASSASTSASSALTSANSASTSASSALTSANSAATSATAAATSASSAATSATAAATSATSAAASATAASTSATSAAASATAAATSASSASTSASSALTSANSASTSATAASTSASSASTSASSALTSANSASTSATSAATSATSAAASAASANAAASAAPEFRQYASEGSVLNNVPARVAEAETLLKQAVWWIDAAHSSASSQTINNLGWGGSALNVTNGSSTSSDSNDALYLGWDGVNYVYTPGVSGNGFSVADAAPLDITGDIDLRVQMNPQDWTTGAGRNLISKGGATTWSYCLFLNAGNRISLSWSTDGVIGTRKEEQSTVQVPLVDATTGWIRATLDVDNGASGYDVKFFTSTDGTTWTQLGTTVTGAGATSIFSGTGDLILFSNNALTSATEGKIYRAQVLNGIDGVPVLDVDTSVITSGAATSFTALTGQTVTVNRSTSGRKTVCVVNPVWLFGTDDYMEVNNRWLEHADVSENYVYLNGTSGNYMSSPDAAAISITGDLDARVKVALDDWTPSASQFLIAKAGFGGARGWQLLISTTGFLTFEWSTNGTNLNTAVSTVATGLTDGSTKWVRVTLDVDNGSSQNEVKFWLSDDGTTWTQLGSTVTTAGVTSIFDNAVALEVGSYATGTSPAKGRFYRAQVYNGIGGTLVFDADASAITDGTASTFKERSSNAATVTINKSGTGTFASTNNYLYLPGVASNYASAPDSAALDITGDIDIRVKVALDDWTPSANNRLVCKRGNGTTQNSYDLSVETTGRLSFTWTTDGTGSTTQTRNSDVTGIIDGTTKWVRVTLDVDNGASGNSTQFFTSDDGVTWTQLGITNTQAGTTSIFSSTSILEIGTFGIGTASPARGKFFRAQVLNGIGGTVAFDANFESSITAQLPTTFTESSTNAATVTVNYSGTGYRSAGVLASTYVYPGNPNTFKLSTTSLLDFGASQSFTVLAILREWATPTNAGRIVTKGATTSAFWYLRNNGTSFQSHLRIGDGTNVAAGYSNQSTTGTLLNYTSTIDRTAQLITGYLNGSSSGGATGSTTSVGSISTPTESLRVGSDSGGGTPNDMEFYSTAIWRRALTSTEITALNTYFQGRIGG